MLLELQVKALTEQRDNLLRIFEQNQVFATSQIVCQCLACMQTQGMQALGMQAHGMQAHGMQTQGMQALGMQPQGMQAHSMQALGMQADARGAIVTPNPAMLPSSPYSAGALDLLFSSHSS